METKNFWGDLASIEIFRTPLNYLKEQANILSKATDGMLQGQVQISAGTAGGFFKIELSIIARNLDDYKYTLLVLTQPLQIYPLEIHDYANNTSHTCSNEWDYIAKLEQILSSEKVRKIIAMLISHSKS